jgi:hypothetical protein
VLVADLDQVDRPSESRLVGVRRVTTADEHAPTGLFLDLWSDLPELSAEVSAGLHALMAIETVDVNRERLEFLG